MRKLAWGLLLLTVALVATLAMPVRLWRTGRQPLPALSLAPRGSAPRPPPRIWIDTDAACGWEGRRDPDDCFAILTLARAPVQIAGLSTVFGNAPLEQTDGVTRGLVAELPAVGGPRPEVHRGLARPLEDAGATPPPPALAALRAALEEGPLTVVALGPLTNIAAALSGRKDLQANVARLVAVMGRRPGHLFHPAEGVGGGILFGHGPVFRDFNFEKDEAAATRVVAMGLPTTFIPYEAGRHVQIDAADLDGLAAQGGASAWVAERARPWLRYWREDIGTSGFYPFDLLAAAYVLDPSPFGCAPVRAWVGEDATLFLPFLRPTALLVGQDGTTGGDTAAAGDALYCPEVDPGLGSRWLAGTR